jgi:hypothetical protein
VAPACQVCATIAITSGILGGTAIGLVADLIQTRPANRVRPPS